MAKDRSTNIKIIEFTGLPGCGKTTICKSMVDAYPEYGFVLSSEYNFPRGVLKKVKSFLLDFSLGYCLALGYYIIANDIARKKGMFVYMLRLRWKYARFLREHQGNKCVLLVDQGLVQAIGSMSLGLNSVHTKGLSFLLGFWARIADYLLLIDCDIPIELSVDRLTERNTAGGEFDKLRGIELTKAMSSHVQLLDKVKDAIRKRSLDIEFVRINTCNSVSECAKTIINKI